MTELQEFNDITFSRVSSSSSTNTKHSDNSIVSSRPVSFYSKDNLLYVQNDFFSVVFNSSKVLSVDSFSPRNSPALFGTIKHGYYDDISLGADFYSCHVIFHSPKSHQSTDLISSKPNIITTESSILISNTCSFPFGTITKKWIISRHSNRLILRLTVDFKSSPVGLLRFVPLTLIPESFDHSSLSITTTNGGDHQESFPIGSQAINHSSPVSYLVSANQGFGITDGLITLGDKQHKISVSFNPANSPFIGMLHHSPSDPPFTRLIFAIREIDDTSKESLPLAFETDINFFSS